MTKNLNREFLSSQVVILPHIYQGHFTMVLIRFCAEEKEGTQESGYHLQLTLNILFQLIYFYFILHCRHTKMNQISPSAAPESDSKSREIMKTPLQLPTPLLPNSVPKRKHALLSPPLKRKAIEVSSLPFLFCLYKMW